MPDPTPISPAALSAAHDRAFFGHPRGLSTLFFTEMWERFSYYGMRALLILFMTAPAAQGGLGFDVATAGAVYGLYTSMVYFVSVPGGWVADRILGLRRSVLFGGIIIALGHFSMAVPALPTFYLGLVLIVIGTGLLKPNISALVGRLYSEEDTRRDAGFSIYYMGINLGAFLAPLACGYVGQQIDWHLGFGLAGIGMTLGLVQYVAGGAHLGLAGLEPAKPKDEAEGTGWRRQFQIGVTIAVAAPIVTALLAGLELITVTVVGVADFFAVLLILTVIAVFGLIFLAGDWTWLERNRLIVILILFAAASMFWGSFEQAGSTLNLFAQRNTDNVILGYEIPSSWYLSLNALFIILLAPLFAWFWVWLGPREPGFAAKFAWGLLLVGAGFAVLMVAAGLSAAGVRVSPLWLVLTYLLHTMGELCLSPVGLSAMSKLAPERVTGMMMGVWFLATSVGNFVGGRLAGFYETIDLSSLFGLVAAFGLISGLLMAIFAKPIRKLAGGVR